MCSWFGLFLLDSLTLQQHQVYENYNSVCSDTTSVPRAPQNKGHGGLGRGLGRKKANTRGNPFVSERHDPFSQVSSKSNHKRTYNSDLFTAATGTNNRPSSGFGVYSDPTTGTQVFNLGTSSEMVLHRPTNLKSASPTNIDIGFKPRGLKWKGNDAVNTSKLQRMRANKKNKVATLVKPQRSSLSGMQMRFYLCTLNNVILILKFIFELKMLF